MAAIIVQRDICDHQGTLIAAAGRRVNPLEHLPLTADLIFIDGRDEDQMAYALSYPPPAKIILTAGNPSHLMQTHQRQLFYDQKGVLTTRFGLTAVPTVITQQGKSLLISEILLSRSKDHE
jgi:conjugal transfer pilus assembly protein TraW